jgi:3-deoxy-D-manno-octulosonate 8-phosphate phosphatase (KDO 8-P phosphatase)
MISYKEKLNNISTFIFDVDGVLTDGSVLLLQNEVVRTLSSRDGYALQYAAKKGYNIFIITGGNSPSVKDRLENLGAKEVVLRAKNKLEHYNRLKQDYGFNDDDVLYMGDDIPDYEVLQKVGVSTCPQDAVVEVKGICDYQSPYDGGKHCVRDVIEQTLRVQDKWFDKSSFEW